MPCTMLCMPWRGKVNMPAAPPAFLPVGASVAGYELPSYSASAINDAAGSFPLTDTSAALDSSGEDQSGWVEWSWWLGVLSGSNDTEFLVCEEGEDCKGRVAMIHAWLG